MWGNTASFGVDYNMYGLMRFCFNNKAQQSTRNFNLQSTFQALNN